jgi:5'-nucleotidase
MGVLISLSAVALPLTILYTNDLHARIDRFDALAAAVVAERELATSVLLFDAGDAWQDHRQLVTNVWGSSETVAWMNDLAYSGMALGNHDAYWGPYQLGQLIADADFPVLSANWVSDDDGKSAHEAAALIDLGDVTILVVGLTTAEFLPVPAYPQLQYRHPVTSLREQISLHEGTFDFVFVVAHVSIETARSIVQQVPEVDLFISGHSHERTAEPIQEGTTLIVQSGAFGQWLGRLRVDLNMEARRLDVLSNDLMAIERTPVDVRAGVHKFLFVFAAVALASALWVL